MSMTQVPRVVSAIYKAAAYINQFGPMGVDAIFREIDFGTGSDRMMKLRHAFEIKWLYETPAGTIDVTESTREHFSPKRRTAPYVGQTTPAPYRKDNFESQGLSKKYIPDWRRTMRADVPEWSVRRPVDRSEP